VTGKRRSARRPPRAWHARCISKAIECQEVRRVRSHLNLQRCGCAGVGTLRWPAELHCSRSRRSRGAAAVTLVFHRACRGARNGFGLTGLFLISFAAAPRLWHVGRSGVRLPPRSTSKFMIAFALDRNDTMLRSRRVHSLLRS
jgi:hypothetical protein